MLVSAVFVSKISHYLHWTDIKESLYQLAINRFLRIFLLIYCNSTVNLIKNDPSSLQIHVYNLAIYTDIEVDLCVVVADSHAQLII